MKPKISPSPASAETREAEGHPSDDTLMSTISSQGARHYSASRSSAYAHFSVGQPGITEASQLAAPPPLFLANVDLSWYSTDSPVGRSATAIETLEADHSCTNMTLSREHAATAGITSVTAATGDVKLAFDLRYSLGITIDASNLSVLDVQRGGQAENLGVQPLWAVASANGVPCSSQEDFDFSLDQVRHSEHYSESMFSDQAFNFILGFRTHPLISSRSDASDDDLSCLAPPVPMPSSLSAFFAPIPDSVQPRNNPSPSAASESASEISNDASSLESNSSDTDDSSERRSHDDDDNEVLEHADSKSNADASADIQIVYERWGYVSNGSKVREMAKCCPCGNDFMHDSLFCEKCGVRRSTTPAVVPSTRKAAWSEVIVITTEEIEGRANERIDTAVRRQIADVTSRLTTEITAAVTEEMRARLLAEWKGKVDVELERVEALSERLKSAEAKSKAARAKHDMCEAQSEVVVASSGERAAMESKLKKLEAKVTSERQAQVAFEKECKKLQSQVGVLILEEKAVTLLEAQLAERSGWTERVEADRATSKSAATSTYAERAREMSELKSKMDTLRAEVTRSEAAYAEHATAALAISAKKEKCAEFLTGFKQTRLRRSAAGCFSKWRLHVVDNQLEEKRGRLEYMHVQNCKHLTKEHKSQLRNIRDAATQQRLRYEVTVRQLELDAGSSNPKLVQKTEKSNVSSHMIDRGTALKRYTFGV